MLIDIFRMVKKVPGMLCRASVKIVDKKQVLARMWRQGNPRALLVGMQIGAAAMENSVEAPQKN